MRKLLGMLLADIKHLRFGLKKCCFFGLGRECQESLTIPKNTLLSVKGKDKFTVSCPYTSQTWNVTCPDGNYIGLPADVNCTRGTNKIKSVKKIDKKSVYIQKCLYPNCTCFMISIIFVLEDNIQEERNTATSSHHSFLFRLLYIGLFFRTKWLTIPPFYKNQSDF